MCATCIVQHECFSFCVFFFFFVLLSFGGSSMSRGREGGARSVEEKKKKKIQITQIDFQYKEKTLKKKRNKDVKGMILFWSFDVYECTLYKHLSGFIARCCIIHMFIPHSFFYFLQLANMAKQKLDVIPVCAPRNNVKNKNQKKQRPITFSKIKFSPHVNFEPMSLVFSSQPYFQGLIEHVVVRLSNTPTGILT
ncbi:unnamed protein product [Boreogadus saida]